MNANPPQLVDMCGTENDEVQIPSDTDKVFYTTDVSDGVTTVTAHARDGVKIRHGEEFVASLTWTFQFKNNEPCEIVLPPVTPPGSDIVLPPLEVKDPVKPAVNQDKTPVASDKQLAVTGSPGIMIGAAIGGVLLLTGAALVIVRHARKARV